VKFLEVEQTHGFNGPAPGRASPGGDQASQDINACVPRSLCPLATACNRDSPLKSGSRLRHQHKRLRPRSAKPTPESSFLDHINQFRAAKGAIGVRSQSAISSRSGPALLSSCWPLPCSQHCSTIRHGWRRIDACAGAKDQGGEAVWNRSLLLLLCHAVLVLL
jgi:hypothetical protein